MLNEEPAQSQDLQMMGMLLPLGIEKGKDFKPDVATVARLNSAAAEAHAWLFVRLSYLAPDIMRALLKGRQPIELTPTRLLRLRGQIE
jgi:hypothetical protein